jgi:hypothetical protein
MSDEDVAAVVVYLRSLPPVRNALPPRLVDADRQHSYEESPAPLTEPVAAPDPTDPIERAAYLMDIADCSGCHTNWYGDQNPGIWAGGNWIDPYGAPPDQHAFSLNLTPSPSGIPYYDEALFVRAMRTGYVVARPLRGSMPWRSYAGMTDEDLALMFAALRILPPIDHVVDNEQPPSMCPICGIEHGGGDRNRSRAVAALELPVSTLAELVGRYRFDDGTTIDLQLHDGRLTSKMTGDLYAREPERFDTQIWGAPIAFERDASGLVTALVSVELRPWRAPRIED